MTEIRVHLGDDGQIVGFSGRGHTEGQPRGEDVICASVTTVFEMLTRGTQDFSSQAVEWKRRPGEPYWKLVVEPDQLTDQQWSEYQRMLTAAGLVFRNMANEYPERCSMGKASNDEGETL